MAPPAVEYEWVKIDGEFKRVPKKTKARALAPPPAPSLAPDIGPHPSELKSPSSKPVAATKSRTTVADVDVKLWAKLVLRCAKALKRASSNLPAYVAESSIQLQLEALGDDAMRKILSLSSKESDLDQREKEYVLNTLETAIRSPGARAAYTTWLWQSPWLD